MVWVLQNDDERANNLKWARWFEESIVVIPKTQDMHPLLRQAVISGYASMAQELRQQVEEYDKRKAKVDMTQIWYEVEFEFEDSDGDKGTKRWPCFTNDEAFLIQDAVKAWLAGEAPAAPILKRLVPYEHGGKPTSEATVWHVMRSKAIRATPSQ